MENIIYVIKAFVSFLVSAALSLIQKTVNSEKIYLYYDNFVYIANFSRDYFLYKTRMYFTSIFSSGIVERKDKIPYIDITYYDDQSMHIVRFPKKRGPRSFIRVYDENSNDVTERITLFMGPCHNFHGIPTTPKMLGHNLLKFTGIKGDKTYRRDDLIVL